YQVCVLSVILLVPTVKNTSSQYPVWTRAVARTLPCGAARNVSTRSVPWLKPHSRGPGGKTGRALTIATMRRTAAGLVTVTGRGGFLFRFPLGITLRVMAVAAAGTISLAWRAGSQGTWASTPMAVWPL